MDKTIANLVRLRDEADASSRDKYFSSFRKATRFVIYNDEFIPFELFQDFRSGKELLQQLIENHGETKVITKYDKKLSKFYKRHSLKREINYIADSISYLKIPSPKKAQPKQIEVTSDGYSLPNIKILASYQSELYNAKDAQLRSIGQSFSENLLTPTNDWVDSLEIEDFEPTPERYWQVAGVFKRRIWGKLQHRDHLDKKIFLCVGIDLEGETIFYGLECLRSGTSKLSTEQIYKFDLLTDGHKIMYKAPLVELETIPWENFVIQSKKFLHSLTTQYHSAIDYIWDDTVKINEIHRKLIPLSAKKPSASDEVLECSKKLNALAVDLVISYEKDYLKYKGKKQLAKQVAKSKTHDVKSYHLDGSEKNIKIIASKSQSIQGALITQTEIDWSITKPDHSYIYTITNLNSKKKSGLLHINKGRFDRILKTKPERYVITN